MFIQRMLDGYTRRQDITQMADSLDSIVNPDGLMAVSRRKFIVGSTVFSLGVLLGSRASAGIDENSSLKDVVGGDATPELWIAINEDGTVTITCHRSEMGQQIRTSIAQIVADELEASWEHVSVDQAIGHPKYGDQNTDGSRSIRFNFHRLRVAGAAMRHMIVRAAAQKWKVDPNECTAELSRVIHIPTGRSLRYGELARAASKLSLPTESQLKLKPKSQWRYIGSAVPSLDVPAITKGKGLYGIDVQRPGMLHAVVARPPQLFGVLEKCNDKRAKAVLGVIDTLLLPEAVAPTMFKLLGGVAVIGVDTWSAIQGRKALELTWKEGPNSTYNSDAFRSAMRATADLPGTVQRNIGNYSEQIEGSDNALISEYYVPHFSHTPMEPPTATAEWRKHELVIWASVQDPQTTRSVLATALEMNPDLITVHPTMLGGAFGRKSKPDFVLEAALIARHAKRPVKVTWTREDDVQHDFYHSVSYQRLEGVLDANGTCTALLHRTVAPSIMSLFDADQINASPLELGMGATDTPFNVPNMRVESGAAAAHTRIGWLRSVANIYHAFAVQSFAAEMAVRANRDQFEYLLELIGPDRHVDPAKEGAHEYPNYDASLKDYPIDTSRLKNVARLAAKMSRWGRQLPAGHGLGIAVHRSFLTYIATVVEVAVTQTGEITIAGVWLAADAGIVVNPRNARAQLEGGTLYGLSNALFGEITFTNGAVDQSNFHDYRVLRMTEAPKLFEVTIVESDEPPAGIGEPATPPAAPALANAIYNAVGVRVRDLPILGPSKSKLSL